MLILHAADNPRRRNQLIVLLALVVLLVGAVAYNLIEGRKYAVDVRPNSPFNLVVSWRCLECGHTLSDNAAVGPRECPKCGQAGMYVCIPHTCATHGAFPVAFQYTDEGEPVEVKVADGPWGPRLTEEGINIYCPQCNARMIPTPAASLADWAGPRRGD